MSENVHKDGSEDEGMKASRPTELGHGQGFNMEVWWEERSLTGKILWGIGFAIMGIGLFAILGWVTMLLWNWLMPEIFGLKSLNYWQAWGLLLLCSILFKHWGSPNNSSSSRRTDRKRREHLRRYLGEDQGSGED